MDQQLSGSVQEHGKEADRVSGGRLERQKASDDRLESSQDHNWKGSEAGGEDSRGVQLERGRVRNNRAGVEGEVRLSQEVRAEPGAWRLQTNKKLRTKDQRLAWLQTDNNR